MRHLNFWIAGLLLLFVALPAKATAGYCSCFGSGQFYDLLYFDSQGKRNLIYTYSSYGDCAEAMARTYLCNTYTETAAMDYCDQLAPRCWSSCSGSGISCYQNCMYNNGCRP